MISMPSHPKTYATLSADFKLALKQVIDDYVATFIGNGEEVPMHRAVNVQQLLHMLNLAYPPDVLKPQLLAYITGFKTGLEMCGAWLLPTGRSTLGDALIGILNSPQYSETAFLQVQIAQLQQAQFDTLSQLAKALCIHQPRRSTRSAKARFYQSSLRSERGAYSTDSSDTELYELSEGTQSREDDLFNDASYDEVKRTKKNKSYKHPKSIQATLAKLTAENLCLRTENQQLQQQVSSFSRKDEHPSQVRSNPWHPSVFSQVAKARATDTAARKHASTPVKSTDSNLNSASHGDNDNSSDSGNDSTSEGYVSPGVMLSFGHAAQT